MKTVKVAILGLGTVGSGVYKLIQKRADGEDNRCSDGSEEDSCSQYK